MPDMYDLHTRRDEIRKAQRSDPMTQVLCQYVYYRPQKSDFDLSNALTDLHLSNPIINTLIRKRNNLCMSIDDVLLVKNHEEDNAVVLPSALHADALRVSHDHEGSLHPGVDRQ